MRIIVRIINKILRVLYSIKDTILILGQRYKLAKEQL